MKPTRPLLLLTCSWLLAYMTNAQDTINVSSYYKNNYIFGSGYWVYQDTATGQTDSITLENLKHGFYGPNPVILDYREYYTMENYSHTFSSSSNDFFLDNLWRVNGGGEWAELGQPVMLCNSSGPLYGGFNGFEILDVFDSLAIGNHVFFHVAWSHIDEDQQYQHEFDYDTDLFYAEDVGLVRKEYTDDLEVQHVWELISWDNGPVTMSGELYGPMILPTVFPNPTTGVIHIASAKKVRIEITDLRGQLILNTTLRNIDLQYLDNGVYVIRIFSSDGSFISTEKIFKLSGN